MEQQPHEITIQSLENRIKNLENCCKEFKRFQVGDMLQFARNSNNGSILPDLRYLKLMKHGTAEKNALIEIFKDENKFQNLLEILENIDNYDDITPFIDNILFIYRRNSTINGITEEQFETLIELFIRKDPDFIKKHYNSEPYVHSVKSYIDDEKKFQEILKRYKKDGKKSKRRQSSKRKSKRRK